MPVEDAGGVIDAWRAMLPVQAAAEEDLPAALGAMENDRLSFWDAMIWATARRVGVRHLLTEDLRNGRGLEGVRFVNPFDAANDRLIDRILPR